MKNYCLHYELIVLKWQCDYIVHQTCHAECSGELLKNLLESICAAEIDQAVSYNSDFGSFCASLSLFVCVCVCVLSSVSVSCPDVTQSILLALEFAVWKLTSGCMTSREHKHACWETNDMLFPVSRLPCLKHTGFAPVYILHAISKWLLAITSANMGTYSFFPN